jgi:xanthine dehydrogenase YagS FAD-binding subunit
MKQLVYERAPDTAAAIAFAEAPSAKYLAGGTNLIDLMREGIEQPETLVDVSRLSGSIELRDDGRLFIGAGVKNSAVAADRTVRERFPMLSKAILSGASGQIRNMASVGGNLLQRTRCYYFYDDAARCNKRQPGAGCDAIEGYNRIHAILGASPACVATHPSDMCVALVALDAIVHLDGPGGARTLPLVDLHRLPGDTPEVETTLRSRELITAIELPAAPLAARSTYRKVRDRASYAFALVSLAAALDVENGIVRDVRLALGGVASLRGRPATESSFRAAADAELKDAAALRDNAFKIELAKRVIVMTLQELSQGAHA